MIYLKKYVNPKSNMQSQRYMYIAYVPILKYISMNR